jgi:hypothetical protein
VSSLRLLAVAALLTIVSMQTGQSASPAPDMTRVPLAATGTLPLPETPEKALVLAYCQVCHDLAWIQRSGGSEQGWNDRLTRMIRSGAAIPRDQVALLAAYLAKALPERARPPAAVTTPAKLE